MEFARPVHPGEYLYAEYLLPLGLSNATLAEKLGVSEDDVRQLVIGDVDLTPEMAKRLGDHFETTPEFWMNFQEAFTRETKEKK